VILLDDASTDESIDGSRIDIATVPTFASSGTLATPARRSRMVAGPRSDARQHHLDCRVGRSCEPEFIECLLRAFDDPAVKLAYTGSQGDRPARDVVGDYRSNPYLTTLSRPNGCELSVLGRA
jgi:hypothetical protein